MMVILLSTACSKTTNSNALLGKWLVLDTLQQYQNPLTQKTETDTVASYATTEFQSNGDYTVNGVNGGTHKFINDSIFTTTPFGYQYTITSAANGKLTTRRSGYNGEQKIITDPNTPGMYWYANIDFVFTNYQKK